MGLLKEITFGGGRYPHGVIKDDTELMARPHWTDSNRIRFIRGLPQKIGGWAKKTDSDNVFAGVCRGLFPWTDWSGNARLAIGTHKRLYVMEGTTLYNITPYRDTGDLTDPFTTTSSSADVTVTHAGHQVLAGDYVNFDGATAVGGITIDGDYIVQSVTDDDNYVITHTSNATSSTSGGGTVAFKYEIHIGRQDGEQGAGWGVGPYGEGAYGNARSSSVILHPQIWMFDRDGEFLIAKLVGGGIFRWTLDTNSRASLIANAPRSGKAAFMTPEGHLVSLGPQTNRMLIEWADQEDITDWAPSDINTAGSRAITGGNEIVAGLATRRTNLIFTDSAIWSMNFIGGLDVFGFERIGDGDVGLIAPHALTQYNNVAYWMGRNDFYMYDNAVKIVRNSSDIRRFVFDNLVSLHSAKVYCGANGEFKEIWWFYTTTTENNRYVKFNIEEEVWDVGALEGTAWADKSSFALPIRAASDGYLYDHETGNDDDGNAMGDYITSSPFMIGDGQYVMDILSILPDFKNLTGGVVVTLLTRDYPQSTQVNTAIGTVGTNTEKMDPRIAGRQAEVKYASDGTGSHWRAGSIWFELETGNQR